MQSLILGLGSKTKRSDFSCANLDYLCFQFLECEVKYNININTTVWMYSRSWSCLRTHTGQKLTFLLWGTRRLEELLVFSSETTAKHLFQANTENTILCSSSVLQFQEAKPQHSNTANRSVGQGAISHGFFLCC